MDFVYGNIKHTLINDTITGIINKQAEKNLFHFLKKREIIVQIIELNIIAVVLYLDA